MVIRANTLEQIPKKGTPTELSGPSHQDILHFPEIGNNNSWLAKWSNEKLDDWRVVLDALSCEPRLDFTVRGFDVCQQIGDIAQDAECGCLVVGDSGDGLR